MKFKPDAALTSWEDYSSIASVDDGGHLMVVCGGNHVTTTSARNGMAFSLRLTRQDAETLAHELLAAANAKRAAA